MTRRFIKRNGVLIATLAAYVSAVVAFAVGLDLLIYQKEKRDLFIRFTPDDFFPSVLPALSRLVEEWQAALQSGQDDTDLVNRLVAESQAIVEGPSAIYHVSAKRPDGSARFDVTAEKMRDFNNARNSLWLRSFTISRVRDIGPDHGPGPKYTLRIYFTTPKPPLEELRAEMDRLNATGNPSDRAMALALGSKHEQLAALPREIERITSEYRRITYAIAAALTLITGLFIRRLVLPMRGVIGSIEDSTHETTRFIARPRTQLERLYNEMARDTVLARMQERQLGRIQTGPPMTGWEMIRGACDELVGQRAAALAACVEMSEEGPGRLQLAGRALVAKAEGHFANLEEENLVAAMAEKLGGGAESHSKPDSPLWLADRIPGDGRGIVASRFADPERPGIHWGLAIAIDARGRSVDADAAEALLARFSRILQTGLDALVAHGRTLTRERDRAGINLSRNLGHDLTNIIATSKLELMTLEELLRDGAPPPAGPRREILKESLAGLLNSTRFLQEVVNLYRAYAFLKEPVLELHNPNDLVMDTVRLFRLSTSEKVLIVENLDSNAPRCRVDPRLLKLALFNLFSNAVDAIRRGPTGEGGRGTITVSTGGTPDGALEITVHDSGPGIRNMDGSVAKPEDIEKIFSLGWSVGRDPGEGEGLGLNWVRTIVVDLHGGRITAENHSGGGALFRLVFPPAGT